MVTWLMLATTALTLCKRTAAAALRVFAELETSTQASGMRAGEMERSRLRWLLALLCLIGMVPHDVSQAARPQASRDFAHAVQQLNAHDSEAALTSWRRLAIELPDSSEVNNNLAVALARCGQLTDAQQVLEHASRLQPKYASIHHNLRKSPSDWTTVEVLPAVATTRTIAMTHDVAERRDSSSITAHDGRQLASLREAQSEIETMVEKLTALPEARAARVTMAFERWAQAWRSQDIEAYLAAYAKTFAAPHHETWVAIRRKRIASSAWIKLQTRNAEWAMPQVDRAIVRFTQQYASPILRERSTKQLTWQHIDDHWRIIDEQTLSRSAY